MDRDRKCSPRRAVRPLASHTPRVVPAPPGPEGAALPGSPAPPPRKQPPPLRQSRLSPCLEGTAGRGAVLCVCLPPPSTVSSGPGPGASRVRVCFPPRPSHAQGVDGHPVFTQPPCGRRSSCFHLGRWSSCREHSRLSFGADVFAPHGCALVGGCFTVPKLGSRARFVQTLANTSLPDFLIPAIRSIWKEDVGISGWGREVRGDVLGTPGCGGLRASRGRWGSYPGPPPPGLKTQGSRGLTPRSLGPAAVGGGEVAEGQSGRGMCGGRAVFLGR